MSDPTAAAAPVLIALDSFKGSIGAADAARAVEAGWRAVSPIPARLTPMADGGEGTVDAFAAAAPAARRIPVRVTGPDDRPVEASWLLLPGGTSGAPGDTAVVELASTSGIELLGERRLPLEAHTVGFGEAIAHALRAGVDRLVLGIGSSASTDGGAGMLTALGARLLDASGDPIPPGGRGLDDVSAVDLSGLAPLPPGGVTVLTDVTNPLLGPLGAAAVFGPQKGTGVDDIARLDDGLARLAALLGVDPGIPGSGAAGGTALALLAWGAHLEPGAPAVAELLGLPALIASAALVITGEGSYDSQSASGKAPAHVAALARAAGVPVAVVAGRIAPDADLTGLAAAVSLTDLAGSPAAAMADPARWLREAGGEVARGRSADR